MTHWQPGFRHHVEPARGGWRCLACDGEFRTYPADGEACPGPSTRPTHWIEFALESYGSVTATVRCTGGPDDPCHQQCAQQGCLMDDPDCTPEQHGRVDYGKCVNAEWIDAEGWEDLYEGPRVPLRNGRIVFEWTCGGGPRWRYA